MKDICGDVRDVTRLSLSMYQEGSASSCQSMEYFRESVAQDMENYSGIKLPFSERVKNNSRRPRLGH